MSDEKQNGGEETAALFVSAQKKKAAEEEARKKAEAEQAKRDAAEAEVRRMEEEVEERKRKAEEERRALEEAEREREREKQLSAQIGNQIESGKEKVKAAVSGAKDMVKKEGGNKKLPIPLLAGIGAVVVAAIVLAVIFLGKGKGIDHTAVEMDGKYDVQASAVGLSFSYPTTCYSEAKEELTEDGVTIKFTPAKSEKVNLDMRVYNNTVTEGKAFKLANISFMSVKKTLENFKSDCVSAIKNFYGDDVAFVEEKETDISAEEPGLYSYECKIKFGDGMTGVCSGWFGTNSEKEVKSVVVCCTQKTDDYTQEEALCHAMVAANTANAVKIAGGNPPTAASGESTIRIEELQLGLPVPADVFDGTIRNNRWVDDNGAIISVLYSEAGADAQYIADNYDAVQEQIKQFTKDGSLGATYNEGDNGDVRYMESRNPVADRLLPVEDYDCGYQEEYDDVIGGISYWERDTTFIWFNKDSTAYIVHIDTLAPTINRGVYQDIFDKMFNFIDL